MTLGRFHQQQGIALGALLFIVAIIAILAAAIAAGSSGFNASTSTENAKAMAGVAVQTCHAYNDALQLMFANGCSATALDYTPNSGNGWPTGSTWNTGDYTGGNGTGHTGNGQCAFFDPRGGGLIYKRLPTAALQSNPAGAYTGIGGATATNMDAFAGYPIMHASACFNGYGTCPLGSGLSNAALLFVIPYVNQATCKQINLLVSNKISNLSFINGFLAAYSLFAGSAMRMAGGGPSTLTFPGVTTTEGCAFDVYSNNQNSAYIYVCGILVQ